MSFTLFVSLDMHRSSPNWSAQCRMCKSLQCIRQWFHVGFVQRFVLLVEVFNINLTHFPARLASQKTGDYIFGGH